METVEEKQNGKTQSVKHELERYVLPRQLAVDGKLKVSPRALGIYQALIFGSEAGFSGHFEIPPQPDLFAVDSVEDPIWRWASAIRAASARCRS